MLKKIWSGGGKFLTLAVIGWVSADSLLLEAYAQTTYHRERGLEVLRSNPCGAAESLLVYEGGLRRYHQGQFQDALDIFRSYLRLADHDCDNNLEQQIIAWNRIGLTYESLGQYENARNAFEQAQNINLDENEEIISQSLQANILNNLGLTLIQLGQYESALEKFHAAVNIHKVNNALADQGTSYTGMGLAYFKLGRYAYSLDAYERARAKFHQAEEPIGEGIAFNGIGNAQTGLRRYTLALAALDESLEIHRSLRAKAWEGITLSDRGNTLMASGDLAGAEAELWQAVDLLDSLRESLDDTSQISIFETQASAYERLQRVLIAQNKLEAGLEAAERSRARALVSQLSQRFHSEVTISGDPGNADVTANPGSELARTALDATLLGESPDFAAIQDIARDHDATLVSYSFTQASKGRSRLYIWVVSAEGNLAFEQVSLNSDQSDLLKNTLDALGAGNRGGFVAVDSYPDPPGNAEVYLQELYELLIEPISDSLPANPNETVIFVPQGDLFLVPFPALRDEAGAYLVEKHTILTTPSIQVLALTRALKAEADTYWSSFERAEPNDFLVVGNPHMPELLNIKLPPLPGSEQEAESVAELYETTALVGFTASEPSIKIRLPNARIIHLATHGLLEYGVPEDSGVRDLPGAIALAPAQGEDGLLTSSEVLDFNLKADLVVLSACDTGRGRITGDGVVGLSRSFILAGAPSVVVSLWSVPDAPTAELMAEFYRQMQQGQDKAQALRQAMLLTKENHPDPADWAAFTLIGAAE